MAENKKSFTGKVTSDKMDKSRIVTIYTKVKHPLYKKYVSKIKKFMVHDENNSTKVGDVVQIQESVSRSKNKSWEIVNNK